MRKFKFRNVFAVILTTVIIGSLTACGGEKETKEVAKGFMWKVENGENPMYLVGTMHPGSNKYTYINEKLKKVIDESDILGVEVDLSKIDKKYIEKLQKFEDGKTIEDDLTTDEVEKLKIICKDTGIDYNLVKSYKPDILLSVISSYAYTKAGLTGQVTLDGQLINTFNSKAKKIVQLESIEEQYAVTSKTMDISALKKIINEYNGLEVFEYDVEYCKGLHDAFLNGTDEAPLKGIEMQKENEQSYNIMIKNRNIGMTEKIEGYLKEDKKYIIAVGYMHYFGEDSIVNMLKNKGYNVERLVIE